VVDIGAARARYFLAVAPALPQCDFVGIEVRKKRVEKALEKIGQAGLANCRMIFGEAEKVIRDHFQAASVAAFTILFPDPWPKKRHLKRRTYQRPEVVDRLARTLEPGGLILLKSDSRPYLDAICEAMAAHPRLGRSDGDLSIGGGVASLDRPEETKYEALWKEEGREIHRAAFRRSL